jgi:ribonuclease Z
MRPSFYPRLINGPFDDPGLYIPFQFEKQAVLFDLGDISALSPRDILKISHVFISHTHMDHFCGFDHLLRLLLGREKQLFLYGPRGFLKNLEGKLAGYTWNLVNQYSHPFSIQAIEVHSDQLHIRHYRCQDAFEATSPVAKTSFSGTLASEPGFNVSSIILDHKIECLGFRIEERFHINIIKERLAKLELSVGPWIQEFKQALYSGNDPKSIFVVTDKNNKPTDKQFELQALSNEIARITSGQKIVYIADIIGSPPNMEKAIVFASGADHLFIEAPFLEKDKAMAQNKHHLTAREAGEIARKAGVKQYTIFHFSPRYTGMADALEKEAERSFTL